MGEFQKSVHTNPAIGRSLTLRVLRHQNVENSEEPVMLAQDLLGADRLMDARLVCATALDQDPQDLDLLMTGAQVAEELGELLDARTLLVRAACLAPDWHQPLKNLAGVLARMGDFERAEAAAGCALELSPEDAQLRDLGAQISQQRGLTNRKKAFLSNPASDDGAMLANALVSDERWEEALEVLDRAVEHDPSDVDALFVQANLLRCHGRKEQAKKALRRVNQIESGWTEAWEAMADLLEETGEPEYAERLRAHAATIEVDPLILIDMAVNAGADHSSFVDVTLNAELDAAVAAGVSAMAERVTPASEPVANTARLDANTEPATHTATMEPVKTEAAIGETRSRSAAADPTVHVSTSVATAAQVEQSSPWCLNSAPDPRVASLPFLPQLGACRDRSDLTIVFDLVDKRELHEPAKQALNIPPAVPEKLDEAIVQLQAPAVSSPAVLIRPILSVGAPLSLEVDLSGTFASPLTHETAVELEIDLSFFESHLPSFDGFEEALVQSESDERTHYNLCGASTASYPRVSPPSPERPGSSLRSQILGAAGVAPDALDAALRQTRQAAQDQTASSEAELDSFISDVVVRPRPRLRLSKKKNRSPYIPPSPTTLFPAVVSASSPQDHIDC